MSPSYIGSGEYCYANAAAMLLSSIGQSVAPPVIESLSAVGLGARFVLSSGEIYFSLRAPDEGLCQAFEALGVQVRKDTPDPDDPCACLRRWLKEGPVVIGPLDMGFLRYLPRFGDLAGYDHFVLVTESDGSGFRFHDPKGYPDVWLGDKDLEAAWRAEEIGYARRPFQSWRLPEGEAALTPEALARNCLAEARAVYEMSLGEDPGDFLFGLQAYTRAIERLTSEEAPGLVSLLLAFGLPLGARRSHDLAECLLPLDEAAARLHSERSRAFIDAYGALAAGHRSKAAHHIERVGEFDRSFERYVLNGQAPPHGFWGGALGGSSLKGPSY